MRARVWREVLEGVRAGIQEERLTLVAAGVAFYGMVAMVPALAVLVSVYGLFADPATIEGQLHQVLRAVPPEVSALVTEELSRLSASGPTTLSLGVVIAVCVALWSASTGVQALIDGVGITYDEDRERRFVERRGFALVLTLGAIGCVTVVLGLVVVLPTVMGNLRVGAAMETLASVLRWPVVAVVVASGLGILYRVGSSQAGVTLRWLSPGALAGTALMLVGSGLFSLYVSQFGRYDEVYGSLGAVLVLLLWLWISAFAVLVGARVDAVLQRRAAATTAGDQVGGGAGDIAGAGSADSA